MPAFENLQPNDSSQYPHILWEEIAELLACSFQNVNDFKCVIFINLVFLFCNLRGCSQTFKCHFWFCLDWIRNDRLRISFSLSWVSGVLADGMLNSTQSSNKKPITGFYFEMTFAVCEFHITSHLLCILKWLLWTVNFILLVTWCVGFREEKPQTAPPMSFTWASHIAASMLPGH